MKRWIVVVLIGLWLGWHLAQPINFIGADLGRHIKNGELVLSGTTDVLYKNYYSYTYPQYPFINHHWFFGVLVFLFWHSFGFASLSFTYVILGIFVFYLFFRLAFQYSSFALSCACGLLAIPLIASRPEIRPEGMSMLFCGLFWCFIYFYQQKQLKPTPLKIWLFCLQVIWVNTHIFFFMGPLLTALLAWQVKLDGRKEEAQELKQAFWWTTIACLINPSGLWGALLPLTIVKGFSCPLVENQSIFTLLSSKQYYLPLYYYFMLTVGFLVLPWAVLIKKEGFKIHASKLTLVFLLSFLAIFAVRLIAPYGYFWVPLSAYAWGRWMKTWKPFFSEWVTIFLIIGGLAASSVINFDLQKNPVFGLKAGNNASAYFFKTAGLKGPIFSNYPIGGYLIFYLAPQEKLFIDNRQEAFPPQFFTDEYWPMQIDNTVWQKMEAKYHFNVIFLNRKVLSFAEHAFIINRMEDPTWIPVFADEDTIIFVKQNAQNKKVIKLYGLRAVRMDLPKWGTFYRLDR